MSIQKASTDAGPPSFHALAPLLDRLVTLAERELHAPFMVNVEGWDDGDFDAMVRHNYGRRPGTPWTGHEELEYDRDREAFVARYVEGNSETGDGEILVERVIERYPCPIESGSKKS